MSIFSLTGKAFLILAATAFVLVVGFYLSMVLVGYYLTPTDTLRKSDVIVVLSGGVDRTEWGIKLYQEGWGSKILFVGAALDKSGPSNAAAMKNVAIGRGIPEKDIAVEEKSTNTLENATLSKGVLESVAAKKIILVTSPYHQRRAFETFRKVLGEGYTIFNSPSGYSNWNQLAWWERPASANLTWSEVLKLLWLSLTGEYS